MTSLQRALHALLVAAMTAGLLAGGLGAAGSAWAHAARIASDPAENATLPRPPASVSATFNEAMQARFAAMTVIGPDGEQWSDGDPGVDGPVIRVAMKPGGPAGTYTANYRATSADGHVVTGSWSYEVAAPAPANGPALTASSSSAAPDTASGTSTGSPDSAPDGPPVWPFVAAATAIVAAGALWAVRRRS